MKKMIGFDERKVAEVGQACGPRGGVASAYLTIVGTGVMLVFASCDPDDNPAGTSATTISEVFRTELLSNDPVAYSVVFSPSGSGVPRLTHAEGVVMIDDDVMPAGTSVAVELECALEDPSSRGSDELVDGRAPSDGRSALVNFEGMDAPFDLPCELTFEALDEVSSPLLVEWYVVGSVSRASKTELDIAIAIEPL